MGTAPGGPGGGGGGGGGALVGGPALAATCFAATVRDPSGKEVEAKGGVLLSSEYMPVKLIPVGWSCCAEVSCGVI